MNVWNPERFANDTVLHEEAQGMARAAEKAIAEGKLGYALLVGELHLAGRGGF